MSNSGAVKGNQDFVQVSRSSALIQMIARLDKVFIFINRPDLNTFSGLLMVPAASSNESPWVSWRLRGVLTLMEQLETTSTQEGAQEHGVDGQEVAGEDGTGMRA